MHMRRSVAVIVFATFIFNITRLKALPHTGAECGENPMHTVHLVAQRTGKIFRDRPTAQLKPGIKE